jgi:predicted amidophosphoribosyltransferase
MDYVSRMENVAGAYHVHQRKECRGRTIVLVDDIMTTGATGSECASRLQSADAAAVVLLVSAALPEQK